MKSSAIALTLALGMAFTGAAGTMAGGDVPPAAEPLKITEERYNPGICRASAIEFHNSVKEALSKYDGSKTLSKEGRKNPDAVKEAVQAENVIRMAAFGIDRFADYETSLFNNQHGNGGSAQEKAKGEQIFCDNLTKYDNIMASAVAFQIQVPLPAENDSRDSSALLKKEYTRFNVGACPANVKDYFHAVTNKTPLLPMHLKENPTEQEKAAYIGAAFRANMIQLAQAGLVYKATDAAERTAAAIPDGISESDEHELFCGKIKYYTESLEVFVEKHNNYSNPGHKIQPPEPPGRGV